LSLHPHLETGSHWVVQDGPELATCLLPPLECWAEAYTTMPGCQYS
jgi:hypothetical protein